MKDYCGNCEYYDLNQKEYWGSRYYCTKTYKYRENNEGACNLYIQKKAKTSDCFITTIICEKLGYQDNCDILETLRFIRESYLKRTEEGRALLQEYDIIGPVISAEIAKCSLIDSIVLAKKYILPCYDAIKENRYVDAIMIYTNMVMELKTRFSYAFEDANLDYSYQTPIEELGKARQRLKPAKI